MVIGTSVIENSFTNCHGEHWTFLFDGVSKQSFVRGSDIGEDCYPVFDGVAYGLTLEEEERAWLFKAWTEATKEDTSVGLYLGIPVEFIIGKNYSSLSGDYCPICLQRKMEFEIHHCIWSSDGGPSTPSNLLRICNSCHAVITRGSKEERIPKNQAAFHHQVMHFGLDLFHHALATGEKSTATIFVAQYPRTTELIGLVDQQTPERQKVADQKIRSESRIAYQYFRDLGLRKLQWSDHGRLFSPNAVMPWG